MNTTNKNIFSGLIEKKKTKKQTSLQTNTEKMKRVIWVESLDEKVMWFSPGPGRMIFVHFLDRGDKKKKKNHHPGSLEEH